MKTARPSPLTLLPITLLLPLGALLAEVKMPAIFSDHMVLKKSAKVPVWGKADPGEEVTVTLETQTVKTKAGADGKWAGALDLIKSGPGPFTMTVQGKNQIKIADVLVGEVWLASGQSNMQWTLNQTIDAEKEMAASANPRLRQFLVPRVTSIEPLDDCKGTWTVAAPATTPAFSAVGYYFAKKLQNELQVPVGLIHSSWGGTPSEAWTSRPALDTVPDLNATRERLWSSITDYPAKKQAFLDAFPVWLKETGREDKPVTDAAAFAGPAVSTEGWVPVTLPGALTAPGLPDAGAVWLRHAINIPAAAANKKLALNLGALDAFDSVYWNGQLIKQITYQDYPGTGFARQYAGYDVPASLVKEGENTLALRIYEPVTAAKFPTVPKAGPIVLDQGWLAKSEFALPTLDAGKIAAAPKPPAYPPSPQNVAAHLFNGMINPVIPYAISGAIWYQGESNSARAWQYRTAFPLLITDWRTQWKQGDFPFYFCQLANFQVKKPEPGESGWAELREAQSHTLTLPKTGQAVLIDIGESGDIHPRNKKDVGERLALIALANDYGKKIPFSGPVYQSAKITGGKVRLQFTRTDGGLVAKPVPATSDVKSSMHETAPLVRNSAKSELEGFAICGEDKKWIWADAKIDGDRVVVWSDQVPAPVAVRYAWADNPTCNLFNGAGLPASPFRTDDFSATTLNSKY